jgi:hypothetical protein
MLDNVRLKQFGIVVEALFAYAFVDGLRGDGGRITLEIELFQSLIADDVTYGPTAIATEVAFGTRHPRGYGAVIREGFTAVEAAVTRIGH